MPNRSHLTAVPIADKRGRQTTVYRNLTAAAPSSRSPLPAPVPSPAAQAPGTETQAEPTESYAERLARIAGENARWRAGDRPEAEALKDEAFSYVGSMMFTISESGSTKAAQDFSLMVTDAHQYEDYAKLVTAHLFAPVHYSFGADYYDNDDVDLTDTSDRLDAEDYTATDLLAAASVAGRLQEIDLLSKAEVPDYRNLRLNTHLYAASRRIVNYRLPEHEDYVRLIDEMPERLEEIGVNIRAGMHAAAIRSLLSGDAPASLSSGSL